MMLQRRNQPPTHGKTVCDERAFNNMWESVSVRSLNHLEMMRGLGAQLLLHAPMPFRLQLRMALLAQYSNQNHRPSHPSWRISVGKHPRGETNLGAIPNPNKTVSYQVEQVGCRIHQISIGGEPGVRKGWAPTAIPSQPPPLSSFFKTNDSVYQHSALPIVDETSRPILLCCVTGND